MPRADQSPTDEEVMARLARDDSEALAMLYRRYGGLVEGLVRRYAPALPAADAEDVMQDVFLAIHRQARSYREQGRFRSWLVGIAIRRARAVDERRWVRKRAHARSPDQGLGVSLRRGTDSTRAAARLDVARALQQIPEEQREVLLLRVVEGLSGAEIARLLDLKLKTVWTRVHRARERLQEILSDDPAGREPE